MKKILRKIANKFGYDFIKINVHSADKAHKISNVKVGNYNILNQTIKTNYLFL